MSKGVVKYTKGSILKQNGYSRKLDNNNNINNNNNNNNDNNDNNNIFNINDN